MNLSKRTILLIKCGVFALVFAGLLTLATFCDLQISHALSDLQYNEYLSFNVFGMFLETVGELPIYLFLALSSLAFGLNCLKIKNKGLKYTFFSFFVLLTCGVFFYGNHVMCEYISEQTGLNVESVLAYILMGVGALVLTGLALFGAKFIDKKHYSKLLILGLLICLVALFSQLFCQLIKTNFGRARYRTLYVLNDFDLYTKWYVVNGATEVTESQALLGILDDAFKSFPSGHTAAAAMTFCLCLLPDLFERLNTKKMRVLLLVIAILYTVLVGYSRILVGAHYFSDVLVGGSVTFVIYYLLKILFIKAFRLQK